jgi:pyrroline-5-carboxylate reductase
MMQALAFVGGGQMATALAAGAVDAQLVTAQELIFAEPSAAQRQRLQQRFPKARVLDSGAQVLPLAETVVLAVKPQVMAGVCADLRKAGCSQHLLVSIAAGISLNQLEAWLGTGRVVRVMPNTPSQIGAGAAGLAAGSAASSADRERVEQLMGSVGVAVTVDEGLLHAVTGLSGSGPAYIYLVIEALSDAGVAQGLPRELATRLAAQTVLGAARMVLETQLHPGQLRDQVTSPGGTTIAGIRALEKAGVRSGLIEAVAAATQRSRELGQN